MDAVALDTANRAVGNDPGAAALEWALGGGAIRFATLGVGRHDRRQSQFR